MFVFIILFILLVISLLTFSVIMDSKKSELVKSERELSLTPKDDKHKYKIFSEKDFWDYMTWCTTQGYAPGKVTRNPDGTYLMTFD